MKNIFLLVSVLFLMACSDGGVETISRPMEPEVNALLSEVEALENGLSQQLIMRNATSDERSMIKKDLELARILGIMLNERPTDTQASTELFKVLKRMESFPFSSRDAGLFERVIYNLKITLDKYATIQGLNMEGIEFDLFAFRFSPNKLEPFQSLKYFTESSDWIVRSHRGKFFAQAGTNKKKAEAWLFSPVLNLENSRKLKLTVTHTVRTPEWENFKLKISTDYDGADPKNGTWTEFSLKPKGYNETGNWTNLESAPIDLSEFEGKKITIAFQFLGTENSRTTWQVVGINIKGSGEAIKTEKLTITYEPSELQQEEGDN